MSTLTITAKGQVTLRKDFLQHLGVRPGDKITVDKLPDGPIMAKRPRVMKAAKDAEVYYGIESPKGEIGFYIVGDGTPNPYRCHVRAPSFINLQSLPELTKGCLLADLVALIGTTDIVLGEVDR